MWPLLQRLDGLLKEKEADLVVRTGAARCDNCRKLSLRVTAEGPLDPFNLKYDKCIFGLGFDQCMQCHWRQSKAPCNSGPAATPLAAPLAAPIVAELDAKLTLPAQGLYHLADSTQALIRATR